VVAEARWSAPAGASRKGASTYVGACVLSGASAVPREGGLGQSQAQRDSASDQSGPGTGEGSGRMRGAVRQARVCEPPLDLPAHADHQRAPSALDCDKKRANLQGGHLAPAVSWEEEGARWGRMRRAGQGQASKRQEPGGERSRCGEAERDRGTGKRGGWREREVAEDDQRGKGCRGARGGRRGWSTPARQGQEACPSGDQGAPQTRQLVAHPVGCASHRPPARPETNGDARWREACGDRLGGAAEQSARFLASGVGRDLNTACLWLESMLS
jgi:hypothetical protein